MFMHISVTLLSQIDVTHLPENIFVCLCAFECYFLTDHLGVVGAADPARDELQRLPLDRAHAADQRLLGDHLA